MIFIQTRVRKYPVDQARLQRIVQILLDELKYPDFDISILLTTNATIREYNRDFRHKDKPTDILSFPYHADLKAGERITVRDDEDKNLGDMIISLEYVAHRAQELGVSFEDHLYYLLVHGICHLLGYDHIDDGDYEIMRTKEELLLKKIKTKIV